MPKKPKPKQQRRKEPEALGEREVRETDSVVAAVSSALAVKARMATQDAAAAASALVVDFGVTDFEGIGLLDEADVMAVAAGLCSVSRKKFEALWRKLGGTG